LFIHYGEKKVISERKIIGIFNTDTLVLSKINNWIIDKISNNDKLVVITDNNNVLPSIVSPFTIIKRSKNQIIDKDILWRKSNE